MDLNHLCVLKQLLQRKHVSNTAQALNISQPSVSRSLQKCREIFNDELLVRTTHGYELTPRAELIKQDISSILATMERLVQGEHFDSATCKKTVKIFGLTPNVSWLLPKMFSHMREHAPLMTLDIDTEPKPHFDSLISGEAHFSLTCISPPSSEQDLYRSLIATRDFRLMMSKDHPLANEELTPENLLNCQFGQISLRGDKNLSIEPRFRDLGLISKHQSLSVPVRLTNFNNAAKLAECSDVIFHLPTPFATDAAENRNIVVREVPKMLRYPHSDIYLYWHRRYHNDEMCIWFRETLKQLWA